MYPILSAAKDPLPKEILRSRCASIGESSKENTREQSKLFAHGAQN
jgi:hypothetical protein